MSCKDEQIRGLSVQQSTSDHLLPFPIFWSNYWWVGVSFDVRWQVFRFVSFVGTLLFELHFVAMFGVFMFFSGRSLLGEPFTTFSDQIYDHTAYRVLAVPVTCYLLPVTCYLLPVTCYLLPVTCYCTCYQLLTVQPVDPVLNIPTGFQYQIEISMDCLVCKLYGHKFDLRKLWRVQRLFFFIFQGQGHQVANHCDLWCKKYKLCLFYNTDPQWTLSTITSFWLMTAHLEKVRKYTKIINTNTQLAPEI